MRIVGALVVLGALGASAVDARAERSQRVVLPPRAVGDGVTPVELRVLGTSDPSSVRLDVDAGTLGPPRSDGDAVAVDYTPPRVAQPRDVQVMLGAVGRERPVGVIALRPPAPPSAEEVGGGPLALRVPTRALLGAGGGFVIGVRSQVAPLLVVNVGTIGAAEPDGDGGWRAAYTLPAQRSPQVAIIAAFDGRGVVDWTTVPLYGSARVETRTKPRSRVILQLGDERFGPFRTDASGLASTAVSAAPGILVGTTDASDPLGNSKQTRFELGTPPVSRLLALCADDAVHIFVVDASGAPSRAVEPPQISAASGNLRTLRATGAGHWVTAWAPRDTEPHDQAKVRAWIAGEPASQSACVARVAPAAATGLALTVSSPRYVAGSGPLRVSAALVYPGARVGRQVPIAFEVDAGTVDAPTGTGTSATALWHVPDAFGGRREVIVRARTTELPLFEESARVTLVADAPARLLVDPVGAWLTADGRSGARVPVRAVDAFGNPAPVRALTASAHGVALPVTIDEARGEAMVAYAAPTGERATTDTLSVAVPGAPGAAAITVPLHRAARAATLGVEAGYLSNFGKISAPIVYVTALWQPRRAQRRVGIGLRAGVYYSDRRDGTGETASELATLGVPLLAQLGVTLARRRLGATLGVAGGVVVTQLVASSTVGGTQSKTSVLGAFEARVGGDVDVGVGRVTLGLGYLYAPSSRGAVVGNFGGLAATLGYRVDL